MFGFRKSLRTLGVLGLALVGSAPTMVQAADFAGKTVEVIVPYTEGGGTDVYVRLITPFLKKYLPGNPTMIIRNLPGGASILGSNRFDARAQPDGLTLVATSSSTLVAQLMGGDKRQFDVLKWRQLILSPSGTVMLFGKHTGAKGQDVLAELNEMKAKKATLRYGAKQPDAAELRVILGLDLIGLPVQTMLGLARGDTRQALLRGEMEINDETAAGYFEEVQSFVKDGRMIPMFTLGYAVGPDIKRDPIFPQLTTVPELYEKMNGAPPSGPMWEAYKAFVNIGITAAKGLALPKGTPDDIRDVYVDAMRKTLADAEFQKLAAAAIGEYPHVIGKDADEAVREAVALSPEVNEWLKSYLIQKFDFKY